MPHIDSLLPLYPDDASRRLLLSQALAHIHADMDAMRHALATGDRDTALQYIHKAKGTASFLGGDDQALQPFDQLTRALRNADGTRPLLVGHSDMAQKNNRPIPTTDHPTPCSTVYTEIHLALTAVELILKNLAASLKTLMDELENNKTPTRPE